ncbi:hypothetical protein P8452_05044 [Trifolium repens]|nr:hypothetical protein P8452_05044 [Trifolium repens]
MNDFDASSPKTIFEDISGVEPKTLFPVIRLWFQNYAEVHPGFHEEFKKELTDDWYILSSKGVYHKCSFKSNPKFPLLTDGWDELKNCEGFGDNVHLDLAYYGGNLFSVIYVKHITSCVHLVPFHSRSIFPKIGDNLKVKLGYDWSLICECNKFAGGDVVRFKFDTDFRCHLFKSGKF